MSNAEPFIITVMFFILAFAGIYILALRQDLRLAKEAVDCVNQLLVACDVGEKLNLVHFRRVMELEARSKKMSLHLHKAKAEAKEHKEKLDLICNTRRIGKPDFAPVAFGGAAGSAVYGGTLDRN